MKYILLPLLLWSCASTASYYTWDIIEIESPTYPRKGRMVGPQNDLPPGWITKDFQLRLGFETNYLERDYIEMGIVNRTQNELLVIWKASYFIDAKGRQKPIPGVKDYHFPSRIYPQGVVSYGHNMYTGTIKMRWDSKMMLPKVPDGETVGFELRLEVNRVEHTFKLWCKVRKQSY